MSRAPAERGTEETGVTRPRRRRWLRGLGIAVLTGAVALVALVGIGYAMTDIPDPNQSSVATATRILYSDRSELGRVGSENRVPVQLSEVPVHVRNAVLAAEDRGFYSEPGISPKGIARALLTNVRGGGGISQGGSTITQQYAKNAFLTSDRTYTRKVKEVFIALKMTRQLPQDQILEDYLNTIYFGRRAAGIEVASKAYFGRSVDQLSVAQGAVLAASIRSPAALDPVKHPQAAKDRWDYVLNGMVEQGWLSPAERAAQVYPSVLQPGQGPRTNDLSGPKGHIISQVLDELSQRGFDEARLSRGGLVVQTTIRRGAQEAAIKAVQERTGASPGADALQGALVSIKPGTGEVWAYYAGATGTGFDFARNGGVGRQPGSSFKPYVLATALSQGLSLNTRLDGNSPKDFPGVKAPIRNFADSDYGRVDLVDATRNSVNTAYFQLGQEVGPDKVAELAHAAGIPDTTRLADEGGQTNGSIALGAYDVQVMDQAVGYATFANGGQPVRPFFVFDVQDSTGKQLYRAQTRRLPRAFSTEVAADATYAMQQVVDYGTGRGARLDGGREAAGKTGTTSNNVDVWFCGFTPQLATAVWFGYAQQRPIEVGVGQGTGGGVAAPVWKSYMDAALQGQPDLALPARAGVGIRGRLSDTPRSPRSRPRPLRTTAPIPTPTQAVPSPPPPAEPSPAPVVPSAVRTRAPAPSAPPPPRQATEPAVPPPAGGPASRPTPAG